jgi:haloacetate dehalogenase
VLLLHGYPETSLAWRNVAPDLANEFTVIAADLPGYGESTLSESALDDGRISKRTMGRALADVMRELGISQFAVIGHDRGARVAYRMTLDHSERIRALAVLDVIPILDMAERLTYDAAREMGHWFWLAQSSTAPETLVGRDPDLYVRPHPRAVGRLRRHRTRSHRRVHPLHAQPGGRSDDGRRGTERTGSISSTTKPIERWAVESRARCSPCGRTED